MICPFYVLPEKSVIFYEKCCELKISSEITEFFDTSGTIDNVNDTFNRLFVKK